MRANIGCGDVPTAGWQNFDSSPTLRLAKVPLLAEGLGALGLLDRAQRQFARFARTADIRYADATRHIPLPDASLEALYSAHMLEHLHPDGARAFLREARRVLRAQGVLRLAVPDLQLLVTQYLTHRDADALISGSLLATPVRHGVKGLLRQVIAGDRHHLWMYDGRSLCRLLEEAGFLDPQTMPAGETRIADPGSLDLRERIEDSVYVEAVNPGPARVAAV